MKTLSLRGSVVALALCCVVGGQLISTLVLLVVPYQVPRAMSTEFVLAAIEGNTGPGVDVTRENAPPFGPTPPGYAQWVARCAAAVSGHRLADIQVRPLAETASIHPDVGIPSTDVLARQAADPTTAGALKSVPFPPFELALAAADGTWRVARPARSYLADENARILLSFAVAIVCLAPLVWWSARRLTRPFRVLTDASLALARDPGMPPLHVDGPREMRAATTALNHMRAHIARHHAERATLMAALAHDLRTPLTGLRIRAEMLPDKDRRTMVADIARLDLLVADMLVFARGGRPNAPRQAIDLAALCGACATEANDLGQSVDVVIDGPVRVHADAMSVRRAIENLLSNALAYGSNVKLHVVAIDDRAEVHVVDEGPGLPPELLEQIFEPFFRLETSRSRHTGGAGLGLAIARAIARSHGGDVRLSNRPHGGLDACLWLHAHHG